LLILIIIRATVKSEQAVTDRFSKSFFFAGGCDDVIIGGDGDDLIFGREGDDGNDDIAGVDGSDVLAADEFSNFDLDGDGLKSDTLSGIAGFNPFDDPAEIN